MESIIIGIILGFFLIIALLKFFEEILPNPLIRYLIAFFIVGISFFLAFSIDKERKEEIEKERLAKKIEFVVEKKEKVSNFLYNDYYLKSNKGIISVDKIDYYNFEKGDTLIIKEKELNKSANILDYRKVKK